MLIASPSPLPIFAHRSKERRFWDEGETVARRRQRSPRRRYVGRRTFLAGTRCNWNRFGYFNELTRLWAFGEIEFAQLFDL
ncbi:hypothetical protein L596_027663 [Steinernema carpocapsae]|uniref:Uncharacterized protein n=1 Tax=Steinernema carpocapsae TaxID=34508 RepID=A0A4U5LW52_STECR|nr:hypothetical protein L596_027663 [Steinernema carpocapsae]